MPGVFSTTQHKDSGQCSISPKIEHCEVFVQGERNPDKTSSSVLDISSTACISATVPDIFTIDVNFEVKKNEVSQNFTVYGSDVPLGGLPTFLDTDVKISELLLAGTGQPTNDHCGDVHSFAVCCQDPTHTHIPIPDSCGRVLCPICYGQWVHRAAERAANRVIGYNEAIQAMPLEGWRKKKVYHPRHLILSPPDNLVDPSLGGAEGIKEIRAWGYDTLKKLGILGAAVVVHIYRIKEIDQEWIHAGAKLMGVDRWTFLKTKPNWKDYVYFAPHVHAIAYGFARIRSDLFQEQTGIVYKMGKKITDPQGLVAYLLSHAPVHGDRVSITYWGCLSTKVLRIKKTRIEKIDCLCSVCQSALVYGYLLEDGGYDLTDRPVRRKVVIQEFYLVGDPP